MVGPLVRKGGPFMCNRWLFIALGLAAFLYQSQTLHAQDETPTAVTDQNRSGDLPFSTSLGSHVEHVVLATGDLVVNIPIADMPGRQGRFHFSLRFDSRFWLSPERGAQYIWNIERGNYVPSNGLWQSSVPLMTYATYTNKCGVNVTGSVMGADNFIYTDSAGSRYPIQTGREHASCGASEASYSFTNRGPDMNSAGIWGGTFALFFPNQIAPGPQGFFLADGSMPGDSSSSGYDPTTSTIQNLLGNLEDSNGNQKSEYSGGDDTLGRVIISEQDTSNQIIYTIKDSSGTSQTYTVNLTSLAINTTFGVTGVQEYSGTRMAISSIILPNSRSYTFQYDNFGMITQLTLPTGAEISYGWATFNGGLTNSYRYLASRTLTVGSQVSKWTFNQVELTSGCPPFPNWGDSCTQVTETDPLGNQTVYDVTEGYIVSAAIYQGSASGSPLRQYAITYTDYAQGSGPSIGVPLPSKIITQLENGLVSEKDYLYDSFSYTHYACSGNQYVQCTQSGKVTGTTLYSSRGDVTDIKEYDWGQGTSGSLLRHETKTYLHNSNSNYLNYNVVDKVLVDTTYDGNGNQVAQTTYEYDNYTGITSMVPTSGVPQHDYTNDSTSFAYRGNATRVERWRNTDGAIITSAYTYDDLGNIRTITDPLGNATKWTYTDSWANSSCPPPANTLAFPTTVTDALSHNIQLDYFPCTGLKQARKDQNDINAGRAGTTWTYDSLGRVLIQTQPDMGQIISSYNDTPPVSVTTTSNITPSLNLVSVSTADGLGRVTLTQMTSDPDGTTNVATSYDLLGRKSTVTNSYRSTSDTTYGVTTSSYDALNRTTQIIQPDGSGSTITSTYSGNCTTLKDEAGKKRESCTDALGRIKQVLEPDSSNNLTLETDYTYDGLGNLTCVEQHGGASGTGCASSPSNDTTSQWRVRRLTYNSLSELIQATNPEMAVSLPSAQFCPTTYTFDYNGNTLTKEAPAENQNSSCANVTTTFTYDQLNRMKTEQFSDGTPSVTIAYDGNAPSGCSPTLTATNPIYRRTSMCDGAGWEAWSYGPTGNALTIRRTTNAVTKDTNYTFNLDGSIASVTYPASGRTVAYQPGTQGKPLSAEDVAHSINYATNAHYAPQGALAALTYGSNLNSTLVFNSRLQPCWIYVTTSTALPWASTNCSATATTGSILDFKYSFNLGSGDDGDVISLTNDRDSTRSQSFSYDNINRLYTAGTQNTTSSNCWGETFNYDPWGNLNSIGALPGDSGSCKKEGLSTNSTLQNQISGFTYDAAGNLVLIPGTGGSKYSFNAANQLTQSVTSSTIGYIYDGDGKRVEKTSGGTAYKLYWYGGATDALDETDQTGSTTNSSFSEFVFFGTARVARIDSSGNIFYSFTDHLGTSREVVQSGQTTPCYDADFYPFGGEIIYTNTCSQNYKFTGKERDTESGLDNFDARYLGSSLERFMSPDPAGLLAQKPTYPQSWNLYAYAMNNPLIFIDPTGLDCVYANDAGNGVESIDHNSNSGECGENGGTWVPGYADETWANVNTKTGLFQVGSIDGVGKDATVDYTRFDAGAQTDANGGCLSGCADYGFASANANWLQNQLAANSRLDGLDGYIQFLTGRDEALHGGFLVKLAAGPLDASTDHWAGPGGMGPPGGRGDWAASVHDYNFFTNMITMGSYFNPALSVATYKALIQSNSNLMRNAGGIQGAKMTLFFGVTNTFQWYVNTWK